MGELWKLFEFGSVVRDFCNAVDAKLWEAMEDRLATLMEQGNAARMPVSEPIGDSQGLFALRANADNLQGRLIYFFGPERKQIVFVHSVLKKTRRIPREDIKKAMHNKKLVLANVRTVNAFGIDPSGKTTTH